MILPSNFIRKRTTIEKYNNCKFYVCKLNTRKQNEDHIFIDPENTYPSTLLIRENSDLLEYTIVFHLKTKSIGYNISPFGMRDTIEVRYKKDFNQDLNRADGPAAMIISNAFISNECPQGYDVIYSSNSYYLNNKYYGNCNINISNTDDLNKSIKKLNCSVEFDFNDYFEDLSSEDKKTWLIYLMDYPVISKSEHYKCLYPLFIKKEIELSLKLHNMYSCMYNTDLKNFKVT